MICGWYLFTGSNEIANSISRYVQPVDFGFFVLVVKNSYAVRLKILIFYEYLTRKGFRKMRNVENVCISQKIQKRFDIFILTVVGTLH